MKHDKRTRTDRLLAAARRTWVYVMRPAAYEIDPCECGNSDPDWSEYRRHLWCQKCCKDFVPKHSGIFDGPIPVNTSRLLGISFDRFNLATEQIEKFETIYRDAQIAKSTAH